MEKINNYKIAAIDMFRRLDMLAREEVSRKEDIFCEGSVFTLSYFGKKVVVDTREKLICDSESGLPLSLGDHLVVLAYLLKPATAEKTSGVFRPFREIKKAAVFERAFLNGIRPLCERFTTTKAFRTASERAGFESLAYKDASAKINAFAMIPVAVIFHEGDDEFPCSVNVLFDENITEFIHEENVPTIGARALDKLCEYL